MSDFICPEGAVAVALSGFIGAGKYTIVDSADEALVRLYRWILNSGYAATNLKKPGGGYRNVGLARFLLGEPVSFYVDHINGDTLDNRRFNLRLATKDQNGRNRKKNVNGISDYKGVKKDKPADTRWHATISHDGVKYSLGYHDTEVTAAEAYDKAARFYHGEFARTNFSGDAAVSAADLRKSVRRRKLHTDFKGVFYSPAPSKKPWRAEVGIPLTRKTAYVGRFDTAEEAARAYDRKAAELFGEFARLNFPVR